jgi:hypothetical protein
MSRITESARMEDCQVRLPDVCTFDPMTTIWSHCRSGAAGKGRGIKALDLCGAYACTACDAVYDGQRPRPHGMTKEYVDLAWADAHYRSLVILEQRGLVKW